MPKPQVVSVDDRGRIICTTRVAAVNAGLSASTLGAHYTGLERPGGSLWILSEVVEERFKRNQKSRGAGGGDDSLAAHRLRKERAQADKAELEVRHMEGALVDAAALKKILDRAFASFRTRVLSLPASLGPVLENRDAKSIRIELEAELRRALDDLAAIDIAEEPEDDETD